MPETVSDRNPASRIIRVVVNALFSVRPELIHRAQISLSNVARTVLSELPPNMSPSFFAKARAIRHEQVVVTPISSLTDSESGLRRNPQVASEWRNARKS